VINPEVFSKSSSRNARRALERAERSPTRRVYFVEAVGAGVVKVGWTRDVATRLRVMSQASWCELRVLRIVDGGPRRERELHAAFAKHRVRGEWFLLEPIREAIEALGEIDHAPRWACICGKPIVRHVKRCRACYLEESRAS
jgi:hypothetical protein